ncbi:ATP phosphoribosyltransferase regulatory subunit [Clostridium sp. JN-1]|jgi:ATP phosphoribosyltransferase regulatory subunit|uniref:ATP phosphoribosyltransferase regulatory subunit n=1 Tax=Clostridium sp. JN-1 TaxID=2483110 RepID=UPI000F0BA012|nr:ATP phosphoribosyltransferase regulatory subunit [Clostridium sp. JN-1]
MANWRRYIPEGTKDTLFEECSKKIYIENILRKTYVESGFMELKSPTLEFYDVFNIENTTLPQEKMYKLFDNQGRILVLKPDMTIPIARIAAAKLNEAPHPLKLCYTSNIYRVNESLHGNNNEITQSGIEIIGVKSLKADVEAIIIGIRSLLNCGLKDFKIELGQAEFFKAVIEETNLEDEKKEKLRKSIESKNFTTLSELLEVERKNIDGKVLNVLREMPGLFGGIEILDKAEKLTLDNEMAQAALNSIRKVYAVIESIGLSSYLSIDLGMVQDLNYYTGIIFRGYTHGVGGNILTGGRYDNLITQFGDNEPATGFAIDVDSVLSALDDSNQTFEDKRTKVLICYGSDSFKEAYEKALELRNKGIIAEVSSFDNNIEAANYAEKKNMKLINL